MKQVKVIQDEEALVSIEVLAESIKSISDGVDKLLKGPLKHDALVLLIRNAAPKVRPNGRYSQKTLIPAKDVEAVLQGIQGLKKEYLK